MLLILLGIPGSGKGTISERLEKADPSYLNLSLGTLLREESRKDTPQGKEIKEKMAAGELLSDTLTFSFILSFLREQPKEKTLVLDGFPRTTPQAEMLHESYKPDGIINLSLTDEEVLARLEGRRLCSGCGRSYHIQARPPLKEGVCDFCGGKLIIRSDDTKEAINNRIKIYHRSTAPLIHFYKEKGVRILDIDTTETTKGAEMKILDCFGETGSGSPE